MVTGILVLIVTTVLAFLLIQSLKSRYPFINQAYMMKLYVYHVLLAFVYYVYATFNPSDSQFYYLKVSNGFRGPTWGDYYGTSTSFIEFIGYPFVNYLQFSYEGVMAIFAFFGFIGFIYFFIFYRENIHFKHTLFGYDLQTIIFFLPNLHFWSSSFGKGSVIFLGIALFFYGISNIKSRWVAIVFAGFLIYHVRPHIMLVMLVSSAIGFVFTTRGISVPIRLLFLAGVAVAF
jgi:hypothetical protein